MFLLIRFELLFNSYSWISLSYFWFWKSCLSSFLLRWQYWSFDVLLFLWIECLLNVRSNSICLFRILIWLYWEFNQRSWISSFSFVFPSNERSSFMSTWWSLSFITWISSRLNRWEIFVTYQCLSIHSQ